MLNHQFALSPESVLAMGVRYEDEVLLCQVCMYGPSPAVFLVNNLTSLACFDVGLKHNAFVEPFIDDIFSTKNSDEIRLDLEKFGFTFNPKKTQKGVEVEYCGLRLNAVKKRS